jgi:hypothetical protein
LVTAWLWWQMVQARRLWRVARWRAKWATVHALRSMSAGSRFALRADDIAAQARAERRAIADWFAAQQQRLTPEGDQHWRWLQQIERAPRRPQASEPWAVYPGSGAETLSQPARNEWFGVNTGDPRDLWPAPDDDEDWRGTSDLPFTSPAEVGRRRR